MNLDEAILRTMHVAAPNNKGTIVQELQRFRKPFDDRLSLAPDKLANVWATLMTASSRFMIQRYLQPSAIIMERKATFLSSQRSYYYTT